MVEQLKDWKCTKCGECPADHPCPAELNRLGETAAALRENHRRLANTATSAHVAITRLCREQYGRKYADWPDHAQRVLNQLSIWGCHP